MARKGIVELARHVRELVKSDEESSKVLSKERERF